MLTPVKHKHLFLLGFVLIATLACGTNDKSANDNLASNNEGESVKNTEQGLQVEDMKIGDGQEIKSGDMARMHYTGWLTDGTKFDSSLDRGIPFEFKLGAGNVIKGWDKGVVGMKVNGKRRLIISPEMGYGTRGAGSVIPPNATLIFEVELLGIE